MKKLFNASLAIVFLSLLCTQCSKNEVASISSLSHAVSNNATTPDLSTCKIRRIYQPSDEFVATGLFSYNKAGNPFSLIYSPGGTGHSDHYFIYDAQNRLTEYQLKWGDFIIERHIYSYNTKNQITTDHAIVANSAGDEVYETTSTIEYDATGRVIKETIVNTRNEEGPLDRIRRPTYTYDNRGNLAVAGWKSSSYDYKVNPLRQSPVFQFVMRNYSMNNPSVQPKYNSKGLPLTLTPTNDQFFSYGSVSKIIYDCQ